MVPNRYVAYHRVSTARQGRSGLGLEAQQAAVAGFLQGQDHELIASFTEVESGKHSDRPQLAAALALARRQKAKIIISKLDRLSRNLSFLANLLESPVDIVIADMPTANRLTVQLMAVVAEHEARMISDRTKAALAAAKTRGVVLGNPNLAPVQVLAREAIIKKADQHAEMVLPIIRQIVGGGVRSSHVVAAHLQQRGIKTARGGQWSGSTVLNLLRRSGYDGLSELAAG